ncbi:unnamed protein product [Euphydryas editha]|uniref:DHHA2 domain-containing protein n=1 Tax=Euphydryas editha TaxID=104508 RepID=A0AAU9TCD6_EUPED|nr:unnamed protein product [Euphydryas editha]
MSRLLPNSAISRYTVNSGNLLFRENYILYLINLVVSAYRLGSYSVLTHIPHLADDINLKELVGNETQITLVDHHVLSKRLDFLTPYVREIIDHRPLDKQQWKYNSDIKTLIKIVGSCGTLIAQRIKDENEGIEFFYMYPTCADLLHSVIILDTVNFSKEVNKATPLDREIIDYLESILKFENCEQTRQIKLEKLLKARSDVTSLTSSQLLRKDLKILEDVFVPSFPILVKEFLQKPKALEAVSEALNTKNCTIAVLLGMDLNEGLKRDVAVLSPFCPERGEKLAKFLQDWSQPYLELVPEAQDCVYFKQNNLSASRKQYMPALKEFLKN